jgi:acetyl-CoA C-acetyltransferase
MREIVIVGSARTPIGNFLGALSSVSAPQLGAFAIQAALKRSGVDPVQVSEVIMGHVLTAGVGQAPARQASIFAGIPSSVPAMTINKVCGSGMRAIISGMQSILLGDSEVVVAGGMENMSLSPFLIQKARAGLRLGHQSMTDSMIHDGLWDPYNDQHMGNCAELCAREKNFSRQEQDEFAIRSFKRAQEAQAGGKFKSEIAAVKISGKKGDVFVEMDEGPSKVQFDKIATLKPVFDQKGSVTAANASTLNDGAAAVILTSAEYAKKEGLKPIARVIAYGSHSQDPQWFTTAPIKAIESAMKKAKWETNDVDLFEINEAFAVVGLAVQKALEIPSEKLNIWGGISLGHPIGASGARIVVTLLASLMQTNKTRGVAGICIGGGEGLALCIERLS